MFPGIRYVTTGRLSGWKPKHGAASKWGSSSLSPLEFLINKFFDEFYLLAGKLMFFWVTLHLANLIAFHFNTPSKLFELLVAHS